MAEVNEDQGKEAKKVLANFNETVKKITVLVKGEANLKLPSKVKKDSLDSLISDLFKEENEAIVKSVKEDLKSLLKGYATLNSTLAEERKKLDSLEVAKKKEFNNTAFKLFNRIEGIDKMNEEYRVALDAAKGAIEESDSSSDV